MQIPSVLKGENFMCCLSDHGKQVSHNKMCSTTRPAIERTRISQAYWKAIDLPPIDFFLQGYMKSIHGTQHTSTFNIKLVAKIVVATARVRCKPAQFERFENPCFDIMKP
ncbi:hypothetical protein AVEN_245526-1 [Araneus ventricosus]|uniref:Uncharacterized protein n=1 Tax=Araneus ventricosus TaxID=182803 RepID=A0A4Y2JVV8_ARAVE|nr:hypothetical protein AVEN_245526-1 [Araneus ventricosus]